ncbi:MAG: hypothetical protein JXR91_06140 [Deltaproteobacteria bacterium]|nr:hypothetical protein [Deltaproteobacteria bacterium]
MTIATVTELICNGCKSQLNGLVTDSVFVCDSCGQVVQIEKGKVQNFKLSYMQGKTEHQGRLLYLPFWMIPVETKMVDSDDNRLDLSMMNIPGVVYISAFYETNTNYLGNPGRDLTDIESVFELKNWTSESGKITGGARSLNNALKYARLMIIDIIDRKHDVTDSLITITPGVPKYVASPFVFDAEKFSITSTITGKTYSASIVESIHQILSEHKLTT